MEERRNNVVTTNVLYDVMKERARQDGKFGKEHDDNKLPMDWCADINAYATWAHQMQRMGSMDKYRRRLIQVAALAMAACESLDRTMWWAPLDQPKNPPHFNCKSTITSVDAPNNEDEVPNFGD